jgi:AcrR family transcriptional regulator
MSRGYRAVSTRDIADAVGLTQPALYHHFGGKEALYIAVLEAELAAISVEMRASMGIDAPVAERLVAVATVLASRGEQDLAQMFHDLRHEISPENRRRVGMAFREAMLAPILAVIDAAIAEGVIAPNAAGLERGEIAMLLLSNVRMLVESRPGPAGTPRSPGEIGHLAARLLLRALSPQLSS